MAYEDFKKMPQQDRIEYFKYLYRDRGYKAGWFFNQGWTSGELTYVRKMLNKAYPELKKVDARNKEVPLSDDEMQKWLNQPETYFDEERFIVLPTKQKKPLLDQWLNHHFGSVLNMSRGLNYDYGLINSHVRRLGLVQINEEDNS